ncbi:MAG: hypothetical protein GY794_16895 [bacterium]|nr:hypothetical protein [bacterium]
MVRRRRANTGILKTFCFSIFVMLTVFLGIWASNKRDDMPVSAPVVMLIFSVMVIIIMAFWVLGEQFGISFSKSRYITKAERKRRQHRRKNKTAGKKILGRKIPDQHDR